MNKARVFITIVCILKRVFVDFKFTTIWKLFNVTQNCIVTIKFKNK